jgi:hypothetical protein
MAACKADVCRCFCCDTEAKPDRSPHIAQNSDQTLDTGLFAPQHPSHPEVAANRRLSDHSEWSRRFERKRFHAIGSASTCKTHAYGWPSIRPKTALRALLKIRNEKKVDTPEKLPYVRIHVATQQPPQHCRKDPSLDGRRPAAASRHAPSCPCTRTPYYQRRCGLRACVQVTRKNLKTPEEPRTRNGAGFFVALGAAPTQRSQRWKPSRTTSKATSAT